MLVDVSVNRRIHLVQRMLDGGFSAERLRVWEPAEILRQMDSAGVDKAGIIASCVAAGVGGQVHQTHVDEVKRIIDGAPHRFFGWVGIDPLGGMETLRYIEHAVRDLGFKGVHVYPHWFGVPVNDRTYWPIYAKCCELGVPVALQVGQQSSRGGAKLVAEPVLLDDVAFAFPELRLGALHIGVPRTEQTVRLARTHANLFIVADAYPPSTWSADLLDYLRGGDWRNPDGADKVLWGTDHPVQEFGQSIREVRALPLSDEVKAKVLGDNAVRWLRL